MISSTSNIKVKNIINLKSSSIVIISCITNNICQWDTVDQTNNTTDNRCDGKNRTLHKETCTPFFTLFAHVT